uniref:Uncharacterized protein from transposable element Tc1 n=1 Tax=Caenorhabditis elegans TaxID=6239 RepID=Y122_CAEEL|nr:RecName: Full=Uncharacterized protein from transposable element Tc1 [Caenorhabditis elegans]CAA25499.1 unnamed protein product [Caenorhabditis elegans]
MNLYQVNELFVDVYSKQDYTDESQSRNRSSVRKIAWLELRGQKRIFVGDVRNGLNTSGLTKASSICSGVMEIPGYVVLLALGTLQSINAQPLSMEVGASWCGGASPALPWAH